MHLSENEDRNFPLFSNVMQALQFCIFAKGGENLNLGFKNLASLL